MKYGPRRNRGPRRGYGGIRDLAGERRRKTTWWDGDFSVRRRLGDIEDFIMEGAPVRPKGLVYLPPAGQIARAAMRHNRELRERRVSPAARTRRVSRRALAAILSLVIVAGLAAAAYLYESNRLNGVITTTGGLSVSGAFAPSYAIGVTQRSPFIVTSAVANTVTAVLEVNFTAPGISAASLSLVEVGNSALVPTCAADKCTFLTGPFPIAASGSATVNFDTTFLIGGAYTWTLRALAN